MSVCYVYRGIARLCHCCCHFCCVLLCCNHTCMLLYVTVAFPFLKRYWRHTLASQIKQHRCLVGWLASLSILGPLLLRSCPKGRWCLKTCLRGRLLNPSSGSGAWLLGKKADEVSASSKDYPHCRAGQSCTPVRVSVPVAAGWHCRHHGTTHARG